MFPWLKSLAALAVSVAFLAAPCKNCEPQPAESQQRQCQHDCCPKPQPEKQTCKWQPADYAAVEAKQFGQPAPEFALETNEANLTAWPVLQSHSPTPQAQAEPPPLFLSRLPLRI